MCLDYSSTLCAQTSSEAHPAYSPLSTFGPFTGVKRDRGMGLTTHPPSSVEVKNE
jgi:hypothetical protein